MCAAIALAALAGCVPGPSLDADMAQQPAQQDMDSRPQLSDLATPPPAPDLATPPPAPDLATPPPEPDLATPPEEPADLAMAPHHEHDMAGLPHVADMAMPPHVADMAMPPHVADMAMPPHLPDMAHTPDMAHVPDMAHSPDMAHPPDMAQPPPGDATTVPATLIGLTIRNLVSANTPWPAVNFGAVRLWDTHTSWAQINTSRGVYNWAALDSYVNIVRQHGGVDMTYTVALTPTWASSNPNGQSSYGPGWADPPANMADYQAFVTALVTRYKGKIRYYEGWNEPNLVNQFYNGTVAQLIQMQHILYTTVHTIDPAAEVLAPPVTSGNSGYLDSEFNAGLKGNFDILSFHFYTWPSAPEGDTISMLNGYRAVIAKHGVTAPIWNSEQGWKIPGQISAATAAQYITRAYIIDWSIGLSRYYYYAWDDAVMGIENTVAATAVGEVAKWIVGADMPPCTTSGSVYTCKITRPNGYVGWIVWNTSGSSSYGVPNGAVTAHHLDGTSGAVKGNVTITGSPTLLDNQ